MYRQFIEWQMLDISREPMEVAPTAHYSMGGIVVDPETHATAIGGLYAAGECVGGLHGANRLGGNSLSETLISGRRAGEAAATRAHESEIRVRSRQAIEAADDELEALTKPGSNLARPLQRRLRDLMWERCGVIRTEAGLLDALDALEVLRDAASDIDVRPTAEGWTDLAHALDLRAGLIASRGDAAVRDRTPRDARRPQICRDFPELDPALAGELLHRRRDEAMGRAGARGPARARRMAGPTAAGHRRAAPRMSRARQVDVTAFEIAVPDATLADLRARLTQARFTSPSDDVPWRGGADPGYLSDLIASWAAFDWRAQERDLNALPQYETAIHGRSLHFLHFRGVASSPGTSRWEFSSITAGPAASSKCCLLPSAFPIRAGTVAIRRTPSTWSFRPCPASCTRSCPPSRSRARRSQTSSTC